MFSTIITLVVIPLIFKVTFAFDSQEIELRKQLDKITQQVVISKQPIWHSQQIRNGKQHHSELEVRKVSVDESFKHGYGVRGWFTNRIGDRHYGIGLKDDGFDILLFSRNGSVLREISQEITGFPKTLITTKKWDPELRKSQLIIAALVFDNQTENCDVKLKIQWYKLKNDEIMEFMWSWNFVRNVTDMQFLNDKNIPVIVTLNDENGTDIKSSIDVFEFKMDHQHNYWIRQHIPLRNKTNKIVVSQLCESTYISLQQSNQIVIYKLSPSHEFKQTQIMEIPDLHIINGFEFNGKHYLFAGGSKLYLFELTSDDDLIQQNIANNNYGFITNILPIKATTYRTDIVILIEHKLHFETHGTSTVDILYYNDGVFMVHDEVPCLYYQELNHGLECLVEEDTDLGIHGGIGMEFKDINETRLLLPRLKSDSEVFILEYKLIDKPSPIEKEVEEFLRLRTTITELYKTQQELIHNLESQKRSAEDLDSSETVDSPSFESGNMQMEFLGDRLRLEINEIKTRVEALKNKSKNAISKKIDFGFKQPVVLEGKLEVRGNISVDSLNVEQLNGFSVDEVLKNTLRLDNDLGLIKGQKTLTKVTIEEIEFMQINSIPAKLIAFNTSEIRIVGDLLFTKQVNATDVLLPKEGRVNNINFEEDTFQANTPFNGHVALNSVTVTDDVHVAEFLNEAPVPENLNEFLEQSSEVPQNGRVICDTLNVAGMLNVKEINGIDFDDFLKGVYLTNLDYEFTDPVTVSGNIYTSENISINMLNNQNFESDFVFANRKTSTLITGRKHFDNLSVMKAAILDSIDDVDPSTLILLNSDEVLKTKFEFDNLELTETFKVNGEIIGDNLPKFLPNPTLTQSNEIKSNIIFKKLKVNGSVILGDEFHNVTLKKLLGDVVYKDEREIEINSVKSFDRLIIDNINVTSNLINDQNISEIVDKTTDGVIQKPIILGSIDIENLELSGLFDDVNITELEENSVKTYGDQYVSSLLIFDEPDTRFHDILLAINLQIDDTINGLDFDKFVGLYSNPIKMFNGTIGEIIAKNVTVMGDFKTNSNDDFEKLIDRQETFHTGSVRSIEVDTVNNVTMEEFTRMVDDIKHFVDKLKTGEIPIKELFVNGSVHAKLLNNVDFDDFVSNTIPINKKIELPSVQFKDPIFIKNLSIINWNNENFTDLLKDVVLKSDFNCTVKGLKTFTKDLHVLGDIDTNTINNKSVSDFLSVHDKHLNLSGPVHLKGNVEIGTRLDLEGTLNDVELNDIADIITEGINGNMIINGDIEIKGSTNIIKLNGGGYLNDVSLQNLFDNVLFKDAYVDIPGKFTFNNQVVFGKGLTILNQYNDIENVEDFFNTIITKTHPQHLTRHVTFAQNVFVEGIFKVRHNLDTRYLSGVDLLEWKNNIFYLNDDIKMFGPIYFENITADNDIVVDYVNDVDMTTIIPLKTEQRINGTLEVVRLKIKEGEVKLEGLINDLDLQDAYENTVKTIGDQLIETETIFHSPVSVMQNLTTTELINDDIDLQKLVTLDTEQELEARYIFTNRVALENPLSTEIITGIDFKKLEERGFKITKDQDITGLWHIEGNITFDDTVRGSGSLDGINLVDYIEKKNEKMQQRKIFEENYEGEYTNSCENVKYLLKRARNQLYMFKELEQIQVINNPTRVESIFDFKSNGKYYLLISNSDSCEGSIYEWVSSYNHFEFVTSFEVSPVKQWITVKNSKQDFIVTRSDENLVKTCSKLGVNIWVLSNDEIDHKYSIPNVTLLQESHKQDTFYGLRNNFVEEYNVQRLKQRGFLEPEKSWEVNSDVSFVPRELQLGLAVNDGYKIKRLHQEKMNINGRKRSANLPMESFKTSVFPNSVPDIRNKEIVPITIHSNGITKPREFVAIAGHESMQIKEHFDFIKIYENILERRLYHKIPTYKPSNLNVLEIDGSQSFLVFLENEQRIKLYQYKGIEGYKLQSTIKLSGNILKVVKLPLDSKSILENYLLLVNDSTITVIEVICYGDKFNE